MICYPRYFLVCLKQTLYTVYWGLILLEHIVNPIHIWEAKSSRSYPVPDTSEAQKLEKQLHTWLSISQKKTSQINGSQFHWSSAYIGMQTGFRRWQRLDGTSGSRSCSCKKFQYLSVWLICRTYSLSLTTLQGETHWKNCSVESHKIL